MPLSRGNSKRASKCRSAAGTVQVKQAVLHLVDLPRSEGKIASANMGLEIMQMKSQEIVYQGAVATAGVQVVQGWPAAAIRP